MKAAVCRNFGDPLRIEEVTLRSPQSDEVLVSLAACAICHSDISFIDGAWGGSLPAIYGHEASGYISAIGSGIVDYTVGTPVIVTLIRSCGNCLSCISGSPSTCETPYDRMTQSPLRDKDGKPIEHGLSTAAFAEHVLVHKSQIHAIPNDISLDSACLLSCGVITGFGAITNSSKMIPGANVAVIGAGGVGLNSIQGAAIRGASRIIVVDLDFERLEHAKEFGATHCIKASDTMHREIRKITSGRGVDYAYITVGSIEAYEKAAKYLAPMGEIVAVGMPPSSETARWSPVNLAYQGQIIRGSKMGNAVLQRDIPYLVDLYHQKRLKLDELISGRFTLENINEAITEVKEGKVRRNVIVFEN